MVKDLLTISGLLILLSISSLQTYHTSAEAAEKSYSASARVVNINTASAEEIAVIPGLGEKKSQAIVKFREKNGLFAKVEDLKRVDGIGDKLFEKIKPYIVAKEESTLKVNQK